MKPSPIITARVCSVCRLAWDEAHEREPSPETCIEALKAALEQARTPAVQHWGTQVIGQPFIQPMSQGPYTGTPLPPLNPNICQST